MIKKKTIFKRYVVLKMDEHYFYQMIEIRIQEAFRYCWQENTSIGSLYESQSTYSQYTFSGSVILVVGGDDDIVQNYSQLSSLTRSCSNLQNYPIAMSSATGAIVDGHPIISGGWSEGWNTHSECYHHNKANNTWTFLTNMSTKRAGSASVPVKDKLLVLGGHDGDWNDLATSEYVSPDGDASQPGPDLPGPRSSHCAVKLSNGQVMLLGGWPDRKSAIVLHPDTEEFDQSLPPLNYNRRLAGCTSFNSPMHDNREVVLSVGGRYQATAEVLDYTQHNPLWTESNYV